MQSNGPANGSATRKDPWVYRVLGDQNFQQQTGFFAWWYRHTSPPDAKAGASYPQRDRVRRGRIASACMLFLAVILIFVGFVAYFGPNKQIANILYTLYPMIAICIFFNRRGFVNVVGILLTLGLVGGMCLTLFVTAAGPGLSPNDKDILYLLFFAELFVAAILPINYVFVVAVINISISIYMLSFARHTPAFDAMLVTGYASIMFRICQIHVIVSGVLWILVTTMQAAVGRANRAEEVARLQHDLASAEADKAKRQQLLEQEVTAIANVHARVANGDFSARVPTRQGMRLWQIAGPLNTLLARYQQAKEAEYILNQLRAEHRIVLPVREPSSMHESAQVRHSTEKEVRS